MNNTTALVSCFARYYHTKTDEAKIFDDPLAGEILSESKKKRDSGKHEKRHRIF